MPPTFDMRKTIRKAEKELIGRAAAKLIADGEIIFLDGGTTIEHVLPHLEERRGLTIVTCGLNIASALSSYHSISLIVVGGELHVDSQCFVGPLASQALQAYGIRFDKAFLTVAGVSARDGVSTSYLDRLELKRRASELARHVAVLADGSKIGVASLKMVMPVDSVRDLITDGSAPIAELEQIAALGVRVTVARPEGEEYLSAPPVRAENVHLRDFAQAARG